MVPATISVPNSIEELGVRRSLLEDLALKILYLIGEMSLHELARHLGLRLAVVEELFERLRKEQLCQVTGMAGRVHRINTTSTGKTRALELLAQNQYAGPAPVSLSDYVNRIHAQSVRGMEITPADMNRAFEQQSGLSAERVKGRPLREARNVGEGCGAK